MYIPHVLAVLDILGPLFSCDCLDPLLNLGLLSRVTTSVPLPDITGHPSPDMSVDPQVGSMIPEDLSTNCSIGSMIQRIPW